LATKPRIASVEVRSALARRFQIPCIDPRGRYRLGDGRICAVGGTKHAKWFSETTRPEYRRPIAAYAMPVWKSKRLSDIERRDVRRLFMSLRKQGKSTSVIKKLRVALSRSSRPLSKTT
jgi:hypothetical protein